MLRLSVLASLLLTSSVVAQDAPRLPPRAAVPLVDGDLRARLAAELRALEVAEREFLREHRPARRQRALGFSLLGATLLSFLTGALLFVAGDSSNDAYNWRRAAAYGWFGGVAFALTGSGLLLRARGIRSRALAPFHDRRVALHQELRALR